MPRFLHVALLACLLVAGAPVQAQFSGPGHLDVLLSTDPGSTPGSTKIGIGFNGDLSFYIGSIGNPIDFKSGSKIFPAKFGEFPSVGGGLLTGTNDPGFQAFAGEFGSREWLYYRGLGALGFWSPEQPVWRAPAGGEEVVLFGKFPLALTGCGALNPPASLNCGFYKTGTQFHAGGIKGPVDQLVVGRSGTNGGFHDHLDWFLKDTKGAPPAVGAYLIELQVFSDATLGGRKKYLDSDPFFVMFNHGLTQAQYLTALDSRINPSPVPEPASAFLLAGGLAALALLRRRTRR